MSVTSHPILHDECSGWFDEKQISYVVSRFPKIICHDGSRRGDTFWRNQFNDGGSERRKTVQRRNKLTRKNQQIINFYNAQKRNKDPLLAWCMATVPSSIPRVGESSLCYIYWSTIKSLIHYTSIQHSTEPWKWLEHMYLVLYKKILKN